MLYVGMGSPLLLPILCYHSIDDTRSLISVSPTLFADHMKFLHSERYHVLSLEAFQKMWKTESSIPSRTLILTFDDGYENNYALAVPILREYGFSATFFIATGFVEESANWIHRDLHEMFPMLTASKPNGEMAHECNHTLISQRIPYLLTLDPDELQREIQKCLQVSEFRMMAWTQIQELAREGMEIGGHSHQHRFLVELSADSLQKDIDTCRTQLTTYIGKPVQSFCYPYGVYNDFVKATVEQYGFIHACTTNSGYNILWYLDRLRLRRILINDSFTLPKFQRIFSPGYRWMMAAKPVIKNMFHKFQGTKLARTGLQKTR